jgi:predicted small lipoprotein YifL
MLSCLLPAGRVLLLAGGLVLALSACGRRGQLEAPPDPAVPRAQPSQPKAGAATGAPRVARTAAASGEGAEDITDEGDETNAQAVLPGVNPAPRRRSRAIVIPKEPFILDPLL